MSDENFDFEPLEVIINPTTSENRATASAPASLIDINSKQSSSKSTKNAFEVLTSNYLPKKNASELNKVVNYFHSFAIMLISK